MRHIVVDMTPLEPRGQNGGAGLVAASLLKHLSILVPEWRFTLLTSQASHAELAGLDSANVHRRCVLGSRSSRTLARRLVDSLLPPQARVRLKRAYWSSTTSRRYEQVTDDLAPDLLVNPFTVPYFWRAGVPTVSVVHDLQHVAYPEFFSAEQRLNRERHLGEACARSERVVCVSDYVRRSVLANTPDVCSDHVIAIPLGILQEFPAAEDAIIERLGLNDSPFLLYPANFWPHKNHRRLFEALELRRGSNLKLVCTGSPNAYMRSLEKVAPASVLFAGYVRPAELAALYGACSALILPSLFEGFGMPVLEAMSFGKPVLCSNVTSLPEVAGDAAVYFDPDSAHAIAAAMDTLEDPSAMSELGRRGRERAAEFGTARDMAERYLSVFGQVLAASAA